MTRVNPDDPKWTAYVLGELDDDQRAAIERELESSEEARMLVEELRLVADLTKSELRDAIMVSPLTREQRATIHASADIVRPGRWFSVRPSVWASGLAAASVAVLSVALRIQPVPLGSPGGSERGPVAAILKLQQEARPVAGVTQPKAKDDFGLRYQNPARAQATPKTDESQNALTTPTAELVIPEPAAAPAVGVRLAPPIAPAEPALPVPVPPQGRVSGIVQDATNARIPGATVTATNVDTGATVSGTSNPAGEYEFQDLQPGRYRITASLPGFQTTVADGIQLAASTDAKRDVTLQVGSVAEMLDVLSARPQLNASGADRGGRSVSQGRAPAQKNSERRQELAAMPPPPPPPAAAAPPPPPPARPGPAPGVPSTRDSARADYFYPGGRESYDAINDNPFLPVAQNPLSTFAVDVDTASYANVRRYLNQFQRPPHDAVRIEEMINYFTYDYPQPSGNNPVGASIEAAAAPWSPQHRLVRVAIKAKDIEAARRPASNLVFLLDVSGSMQPQERLPLIKEGMRMLVGQLTANDRVTIVTYAGTTGVALRPTRGDQKDAILGLIDSLQAGGSTNGGSGIQLAYQQAVANFITGGVNRVILATDGDFNVGITDRNALLRLIEDRAKSGVFLSVLGVGMGNYKDATLEMLADKGHGNFAYLDTLNEARKVLVEQMSGTLITMAKDVKVQVEFNPGVVDAYRLIGYENRALRNEDFNNDLKDGGDMGAGHTVTVLYEVVPRGVAINAPGIDPLKYQPRAAAPVQNVSNETLTVKIRYKEPAGSESKLLVFPLVDREQTFARSSADLRFAAAVASFGMILRDSPYKGTSTIESVLSIAEDSLGSDRNGYRREFLQLVERARQSRR